MAETSGSGAQQPPPPPGGGSIGSGFGTGGSDQQSQHGSNSSRGGNASRGGRGGRGRNGNHHRNSRNNQDGKYRGKCEEIADHVYDVGAAGESKELFTATTREIAEYVARTYENAAEFRIALISTELPTIVPPEDLDANAGLGAVEMYKLDLREYRDKLTHRKKNLGKIFPLILGQCSRTIRDRVEAAPNWDEINRTSDVMQLLVLIRQSLCQGATTKHATHDLTEALFI